MKDLDLRGLVAAVDECVAALADTLIEKGRGALCSKRSKSEGVRARSTKDVGERPLSALEMREKGEPARVVYGVLERGRGCRVQRSMRSGEPGIAGASPQSLFMAAVQEVVLSAGAVAQLSERGKERRVQRGARGPARRAGQ